jgi:hypothetical protein
MRRTSRVKPHEDRDMKSLKVVVGATLVVAIALKHGSLTDPI